MKKSISAVALALLLTACSGAGGAAPSSPTASTASPTASPSPQYDSFEKIGDAVGCLSLANSDPETTDIKDNKYCTLENPTSEGGALTVYEYVDRAKRDKSVKAGIVQEASYLLLSDNWSLSGDVRDLRKVKAKLGVGELRSAEPDKPTGPGSVGPGGDEEAPEEDGYEAETVAHGKSVTYNNQRVEADTVYCSAADRTKDLKRNSCRTDSFTDEYDDVIAAPKGDEFFLVAFRWKNVGKRPMEALPFGNVVLNNGTEYELDTTNSDSLTSTAASNVGRETSGTINPGKSFKRVLVYAVPRGAKVDHVYWGAEDYTQEPPVYALAVK